MIQSSLLDHIEIIPVSQARKSDPITSFLAANSNPDGKAKDRIRTLLALDESTNGLTDFELAERLHSQQTSVGKRRGELTGVVKGQQVDIAYVENSGQRRPSPTGSPSIVWQCTERGHQVAAQIRERMRNATTNNQ
jgi:hypothetical protein